MATITDLKGPAGTLEAILDEPADGRTPPHAAVVFAHPHPQYGGTMHTKAVYQGMKGLTRIGCAVLRFNFRGDCAAVRAPTLIVTGEPDLDRIVPVESTRRFLEMIPGSAYVMIERTGHLAPVTLPYAWANTLADFVAAHP